MLACSRCGKNLRMEDEHFDILMGVNPPIDHQLAVVGEMCTKCLYEELEPLLKRGNLLAGTSFLMCDEKGAARQRSYVNKRVECRPL